MRPQVFLNISDVRWNDYKIDFSYIARIAIDMAGGRLYPKNNNSENPFSIITGQSFQNNNIEISIVLTDDKEIKKLNKKYRGYDKSTNVLSFETGDSEMLGDIFISFDTVLKESKKENKEFTDHAAHMVVHGILHLLGYDHIKNKDAAVMEKMEIDILKKLKIVNPYEDVIPEKSANKNFIKFLSKPAMKKPLLLIAGLIASFGFAPFYLWWATILAVGFAYFISDDVICFQNGKHRFFKSFICGIRKGFWFGAGYAAMSFWWVLHSIFVVPELTAQFAIWTLPGIIGIAIVGGIIFGLPFAFTDMSGAKEAKRAIVFASSWTFVLWLREWAFTGFPWNPFANLTIPWAVLANSMSLWGAIGLTFVLVGLIVSISLFIKNIIEFHNKKLNSHEYVIPVGIFSVLFLIGLGYGYINIHQTKLAVQKSNIDMTFRIVQPALTQTDKGSHNMQSMYERVQNNLNQLVTQSKIGTIPDVIIWPETAYPFYITDKNFPAAKEIKRPVITGAISGMGFNVFNSMIIADSDGTIKKIYSKSHLVPFGEYRPFGDIIPTPGQLTKGNGPEVINLNQILNVKSEESLSDLSGIKFAPAICYEIVFSDSLIPRGQDANLVINLTNDTWFGKTPGTYQHLDMTRRYAIESGLPVIRANYSGISAFVLADGGIQSSLPVGVKGILDGTISGAHMTPYRAIGRDWWMIIIMAFSLSLLFVLRKKD